MQIESEKIKLQNDVKFKHYTTIFKTAQGWQKQMRTLGVQGIFHLGDTRFGWNSEKQCVANSLSAIAHSKLKNADE